MKYPAQCIVCGNHFDLHRDVSNWPIIDDENASEHCATCWGKKAEKKGRPLGRLEIKRIPNKKDGGK